MTTILGAARNDDLDRDAAESVVVMVVVVAAAALVGKGRMTTIVALGPDVMRIRYPAHSERLTEKDILDGLYE